MFPISRWEALHVYLGRLYLEIRPVRRVDAAFSQTHGPKTVQVPPLPALVLALRPPVAAHEETLTLAAGAAAATSPHNDCSYLAKFTLCAPHEIHSHPLPTQVQVFTVKIKNWCFILNQAKEAHEKWALKTTAIFNLCCVVIKSRKIKIHVDSNNNF